MRKPREVKQLSKDTQQEIDQVQLSASCPVITTSNFHLLVLAHPLTDWGLTHPVSDFLTMAYEVTKQLKTNPHSSLPHTGTDPNYLSGKIYLSYRYPPPQATAPGTPAFPLFLVDCCLRAFAPP